MVYGAVAYSCGWNMMWNLLPLLGHILPPWASSSIFARVGMC